LYRLCNLRKALAASVGRTTKPIGSQHIIGYLAVDVKEAG